MLKVWRDAKRKAGRDNVEMSKGRNGLGRRKSRKAFVYVQLA